MLSLLSPPVFSAASAPGRATPSASVESVGSSSSRPSVTPRRREGHRRFDLARSPSSAMTVRSICRSAATRTNGTDAACAAQRFSRLITDSTPRRSIMPFVQAETVGIQVRDPARRVVRAARPPAYAAPKVEIVRPSFQAHRLPTRFKHTTHVRSEGRRRSSGGRRSLFRPVETSIDGMLTRPAGRSMMLPAGR